MDSSSDSLALPVGLLIGLGVFYLIIAVVMIWAWVKIISRSGYSGWWVLIGLVPLVNLIMFLVFAFKRSPAEQELNDLRAWAEQVRSSQGGGGYGQQGYGQQQGYGYQQ